MNLKQRGITVGDLILILIFVISTVFIFNKVKESEQQTFYQVTQNKVLSAKK